MHGFKTGGSGGGGKAENPLNFTVVAYPSEIELTTATGDENTIGVITTTDIAGWQFASEQPENMAQGEVWFITDDMSQLSFNVLKENAVMVYPRSAKQMISGELVDVPAYIRQGDAWNMLDKRVFIFTEGKGFADGFTAKSHPTGITTGGFNITDDEIIWSNTKSCGNCIWIEPMVDLSRYEYIYMDITVADRGSSDKVTIGVGDTIPTGHHAAGTFNASTILPTGINFRGVYEVNVSAISNEQYIKVGAYGVAGSIHNMWLE